MSATPPEAGKKPGKVPWGWIVRVGVSAAVLAVVFQLVPVGQVIAEARRLPPMLWVGGLFFFLLGHAAAAAKWRMLIGQGVSYAQAFRAHLAGLAANLCLPSIAGGDVVRAGMVFKSAESRSRLAMGSIADRLLDTFGLVMIAAVGAVFALNLAETYQTLLIALVIAGLAGIALAFVVAVALDKKFQASPPSGKVGGFLAKAAGAAADLARHPGKLILCLVISLAVQSTFVGINIAFAEAAAVQADTAVWFFAWASAKIIALVPISLGGLGVREASMAGLMKPFGADPAKIVAIGLIWQTVLYASGFIGLLAQALWKPGAKRAAVDAATEPTV